MAIGRCAFVFCLVFVSGCDRPESKIKNDEAKASVPAASDPGSIAGSGKPTAATVSASATPSATLTASATTMASASGSVSGSAATPEARGEALYKSLACNACHSIDGSKLTGGSLAGGLAKGRKVKLADGSEVAADLAFFREKILSPNVKLTAGYSPVMPSYKGQLTDDGINDLAAFVSSLPKK